MEDEYEVGEYYRTKNGEILKIVDLDEYSFLVDKFYYQIVKHSKNIIDLIEAGDYVNGKYVKKINQYKDGKSIIALIGIIEGQDIKSIVTHEQFESIEYKVEGEK